jgi:two-component system, chemotaxis family, protein-glutamate methylesterase/glutaminase
VEDSARGGGPGRIVVVGASAGGVEALIAFVRGLPATLSCPVLVVLHVAPQGASVLATILARETELTVVAAADRDELRPGHVYVAVPDRHLLVEDGHVRLARTPAENGHRPAIDPTLRTAARGYGHRAVGVILSGTLDDGTAGLVSVKRAGGTALAQDPDEARYDSMPRSAARHVELDAVLPAAELGAWVAEHCLADPDPDPDPGGAAAIEPPEAELRPGVAAGEADDPRAAVTSIEGNGTRFTCPDCGGVLFEQEEGSLLRFGCSVGHAFSVESLEVGQASAVEEAMWTAVRVLEDRVVLLAGLADRARTAGHARSARVFDAQAREAARRSHVVRGAIDRGAPALGEAS